MSTIASPPTQSGVVLRPYQETAVSRIFEEFDKGIRSTLLVLPTGAGKTVSFGTVARRVIDEIGGRVLVLAHREELITQAANSLAGLGVESAVEKAEQNARASLWEDPMCVVASVQTLQRKRLLSWPTKHFKLIITDEAHHAPAESYGRIFRHLDADWHLGVTATADRLDGENLGQVYRSLAFEYTLRDAINANYLSPLKIVRCETSVDLANIKTTGGDLNQGDLEDAIRPHIEELANAIKQEIGDRRTIVFTPDIGSADAFASALNSIGLKAESISGKCANRREILDGFRKGRFRVLCNCQILTEGFDAPFVSAIVLARPTKSRSLYSQMVGRGTRLFHGKDDCLVVDFAWLTGKHKLVSPVELFDSTAMSPEVQAEARKLVESGDEDDLMEAIERAEAKVREREKIRIEALEREARYRRVVYNPFAPGEAMQTLGLPAKRESDAALKNRATENQVRALTKFGVQEAAAMSKSRAHLMLEELIGRSKANLASFKQVGYLIKNGIDPAEARKMSFADASAKLDQLFGKRRGA